MRGVLLRTLAQNAKYLAVAIGAVAVTGGTATTFSMSTSGAPSPSPRSSHATAEVPDATPETADATEGTEAADTADTGVRPTDTHGYCVSHAVAAAKVAHKTGRDIAAAAHSCTTPGKSGNHGTSGNHGKSSTAPGRTHAP